MKYSQPSLLVLETLKESDSLKGKNEERIMGSWENEVLQFWLNHLLSSEEWNCKQMAGA